MPELPEVETIARGLRAPLLGRTVTGVTVHWPRTVAQPAVDEFKARMAGRRVVAVGRRGKYVVIGLDGGFLLIHLKMSGRLRVVSAEEPADKHTHTIFHLDDGRELRFQDVRKFGRVHLVDDPAQVTTALGPEPLDDGFSLAMFRGLLERRSGRLKSLLMNQEFLAGLGNIYADEALYAAGLHPLRKADSLTAAEQACLYDSIRRVLGRAVTGRGTTLDDGGYLDAEGRAGAYQEELAVYRRTGEPCRRCGSPVERMIIGGRSSHFCPSCQPEVPVRTA
ncbi:bifunctional DNA-formamidopyrimidine glycosylase/DNA-(apurinic or apyrimidinic site) lyase [Chloroflexota bacterium]